MNLVLKPKIGLGSFLLDSSINNYTELYNFNTETIDQFGEIAYISNEFDIIIYVRDSIISTIAIYKECFYKNLNIVGMNINDFIRYFDEVYYGEIDELDFEEDNIPQHVYEFEDIGAQIWTKEDIIVTVILSKE